MFRHGAKREIFDPKLNKQYPNVVRNSQSSKDAKPASDQISYRDHS
jgi:hypothetical protein